jgi:probable phosphoglycerate mutase
MSKIRLFIARHGETDYNKKGLLQGRGVDAPLNQTGIEQARHLATYLQQYRAKKLVSSSMIRAWQTASYAEEKSGLKTIRHSGLDEMDFGDYEGTSFEEVADELKKINRAWKSGDVTLRIPGGESPRDVFERADQAAREYLQATSSDSVIFFVHGRLIRILLSEWLGYGLKNMDRIEHQNGAVNQIIYDAGRFEPVYLNKTSHMNGLKTN